MLPIENHSNYNCEIETQDGTCYRVFANWIHNNGLDRWKGWQCSAGSTRLYVDKNLQVHSGECLNDSLGSALDNFSVLEHTICQRETCTGCTDDLVTAKHQL